MRTILTFWYKDSPVWFYSSCVDTINSLEGHLGARDTLRNISKPIFQDYTLQGRFVGILLRLGRIGLALSIYLVAVSTYAGVFVTWLLLPVFFIVSIIGSFLGS
jgi:hypothetical protein